MTKEQFKNEITEKTKLNLPIAVVFSSLLTVGGGAGWLTNLHYRLAPLPDRVEHNTQSLHDLSVQQYSLCIAARQIQKHTVPKNSQHEFVCEVIK